MGRPESDDPANKTVCFRVTKSEKDEIDQWVGSRNRSEVLRRMALKEARSSQAPS